MIQSNLAENQEIDLNKKCCYNCKFFEQRNCFCRFFPPTPMIVNVGGVQVTTSNYPKISIPELDWCGQFEKQK